MNRECTGCTLQELKTMRTAEQRENSSRALTDWQILQEGPGTEHQQGDYQPGKAAAKKKNTTNWAAYTQLKIIFSVTEAQKYKTNTMADSEYHESQSFWLVVAPTLDIPWQQGKAHFLGTFVKGIIPLCISFMAYGLLKGIRYINIFPSGSRYLHVSLEGCEHEVRTAINELIQRGDAKLSGA